MGFFKKTRKTSGLLAIGFDAGGVCAARVSRVPDAKPVVDLAAAFPAKLAPTPEALDKIARELQALQYQVSTLLGGRDYQMLAVESPNVQPEELKAAVRWRLKDMLDFHVDDATIDVLDIPADKNANTRPSSMFAIAARNAVIEARQSLFASAKVNLAVIDIPEMAQRNISAMLEPEGRGLAMLSFADEGGLLTVTFGAELYLSRRIDVTLAQVLETDPDRRNQCFDRVTLELQRSLDHFDRQFHYVNVSKLVLAPLPSSALADYLSSNLYMPVDSLNLASVFDLSKVPDLTGLAAQQRHFLTLGAALRHEEMVL
ncbi:agglutinin biogenesis protein MshI [Massilia sp. CF038]|uniref:agglutinin biogenesis protein MshI n=1 Tax=Massilia sp. CF038 TaxID=1881045 RepID=UPI00090F9A89|nr:agglutinin biogenesis protein MshI [Massilia sp. CF038]SHG98104.1 MSHA biogenesis protein MshI [Massilia sp. CF038]